jgi:amino-acid N-acetyltransferase
MLRVSSAIRRAVSTDWPAVKQLIAQAALPDDDLNESAWRHFVVAEGTHGSVDGVVGLEPVGAIAILRSLAVDPSYRSSGLGSALVACAEANAHSSQLREIYLLTTTAEAFFTKRGYQRVDRDSAPPSIRSHSQFQTLCPASAALMMKSLQHTLLSK